MGYKEELLKEIQNSKQNLDIERIITANKQNLVEGRIKIRSC